MTAEERVLVSGAGPVGLYAALRLAQSGIPVTVFEAEPVLCEEYRAAAWHGVTADMFEAAGALDKLIEKGWQVDDMRMSDRLTGAEIRMNLELLKNEGVRNPRGVVCSQPNSVRVFHELLSEYDNAQCLMSHRVTAAEQTADGVTVDVETPDSEKTFSGRWLIGTDGAHSVVRKVIGAVFDGFTWEDRFLIMDTDYDEAHLRPHFGAVNFVSDAKEWRAVMTLPNGDGTFRWRIACAVPEDVSDELATSDDYVQARFQATLPREIPYKINECRVYRVHQRTASTFRKGRMLIAGDAAHLNSPLGGQGANSGIHDVENLCEKLVQVIEGKAGGELLDLYDRQRRLTNLRVIQPRTIATKKMMDETRIWKRRLNGTMMGLAQRIPAVQRKLLCKFTMLDSVRYANRLT